MSERITYLINLMKIKCDKSLGKKKYTIPIKNTYCIHIVTKIKTVQKL